MTEPVTLHDLSYLIDTNARLEQRTGAHQSEHTSLLQACSCPGFAVYCPACGDRCQVTLPEVPTVEEN